MSLLHSSIEQSKKQSPLSTVLFSVLMGCVLLFSYVIYPVLQNGIVIPKIFFLYGCVLLGMFLWVLQAVTTKFVRIRRSVLDIPILVCIGIFLVSTIFSVIPSVSMLGKMNVFVLHVSGMAALALWMWLLIQTIQTMKRWHMIVQTILLVGSVHAILLLIHSIFPISLFSTYNVVSTLSSSSVQISMFFGVMVIVAMGQLLTKQSNVMSKMLPAITATLSLLAIFRIGFDSGFLLLAVGAACLIVIGTTYLSEVHSSVVVASFAVFVVSVLVLLFDVPTFIKMSLPVEISMGVPSSWSVTKFTVLDSAKQFMIGSGPGTFLQSFSAFRDVAFNSNQLTWTIRFNTPHNTLFAILTETGTFGLIAFLIIVIGAVGVLFSAWKKTRPTTTDTGVVASGADTVRIHVFTLSAAWLTLTVGCLVTFFSVTLWFLWWTLLALMITGLAVCVPQIVTERRYSLSVSPQYSLLVSFLLVIVATGILILGAFGARIFLADVAYAKALRSASIEETVEHLTRTLSYRPKYVPYQLSHARLALQHARIEAQKETPNPDAIANYLALAVNTAREATSAQGNDVETWETLASMYLNTQTVVPDANSWAQEALKRALELEPTNPVFEWQMGNAKAFAGDPAAAEEHYKQAIRLKPDYLVAYVSLSALLESQERYDQAIAVYQPIFRLVEQNAEVLFTLGRLFYNRQSEGDLERAELILARAVELSPSYANARFTLGLVYEALGNREKAREQFEAVAETNPTHPDIVTKVQSYRTATPPPTSTESDGGQG